MGKMLRSIARSAGLLRKNETEDSDREFLERMRKLFKQASDAEKEQREHELECLRMCDPAQQWDDEIKRERENDGRPCLTEDRINPFVLQVCNSLKQNRAAVTVNPVDDDADQDTAEVYQGLIRHITYDSSADMAYDNGSTSMVRTGRGFYRIVTEYEDETSFDQVIKVKAIPNAHMVYVDPNAVECDYSDADWFMIFQDYSLDDFKNEFKDAKSAGYSRTEWKSVGDEAPDWFKDEVVRVVECFYKERTKDKVARLSNGEIYLVSELAMPEGTKATEGAMVSDGIYIDGIRETLVTQVKWAKFNACEVLERKDWPGKIIPIIPLLGKELIIDGKRRYYGLVSGMIDPQRRFNWMLSAQTEILNLVPRAPYHAVEGSLVNPNAWANAHKRMIGVLYYKNQVDGQPVQAPQRQYSTADISAVNQALEGAAEGLKGTSGLYNPSIGATETTSQSGIAIRAQQAQGDMSTYHFTEAVTRARRLEGRIMLELIPKIYDSERVLRIVNEDETTNTVRVNSENVTPEQDKMHDLTVGRYDITVTSGPSYTTRRQENLAVLLNMTKTLPSMAQIAPDLIVSQLDVPIAKPLAKRLKLALPPQVQQEDQEGQDQIQPQLQQRLQQDGQMIEQLTQALKVAQDEHAIKMAEIETKLKIAQINADATVRSAFIRSESTQMAADNRAMLDHEREMMRLASKSNAGSPGEEEEPQTNAGETAGTEE